MSKRIHDDEEFDTTIDDADTFEVSDITAQTDVPALIPIAVADAPDFGAIRPELTKIVEDGTTSISVLDVLNQFSYLPAQERFALVADEMIKVRVRSLQENGAIPAVLEDVHLAEIGRMKERLIAAWTNAGAATGAHSVQTVRRKEFADYLTAITTPSPYFVQRSGRLEVV